MHASLVNLHAALRRISEPSTAPAASQPARPAQRPPRLTTFAARYAPDTISPTA